MKKITKIFALILSLALLVTGLTIMASAITNTQELPNAYVNQLKPSGATNALADTDATSKWNFSTNIASHVSKNVVTANGNTYTNLSFTDADGDVNTEKAGYLELRTYSNKKQPGENALAFNSQNNRSIALLDFDFCPDKYVVRDANGNATTYTPDNLPSGVSPEDAELSIIPGSSFLALYSYWTTSPDSLTATNVDPASTTGKYIYMHQDPDGTWYYTNNATYSKSTAKIKMSNEPGVFDHITVAYYTKADKSGNIAVWMDYFINGELLVHYTALAYSSAATAVSVAGLRISVPNTGSFEDCYSYAVDNIALNYYPVGYSTSTGYGADDIVKDNGSKTALPLSECVDMVLAKYISPNGYLQVQNPSGNRDIVSLPLAVAHELQNIEDGATLITTLDLKNFSVPKNVADLTIKCDKSKVAVTLDAQSIQNGYVLTPTQDGYQIKSVAANLEWYLPNGDLLLREKLIFGNAPDTERDEVKSFVYVMDDKLFIASNVSWKWDLGGDIGVVNASNATDGQTIRLEFLSSDTEEVTGATFVMGNLSQDGRVFTPAPSSDGTYTAYVNANGDKLISECALKTYGNTCMLLNDFTGLEGDAEAADANKYISVTANTTLNFDLNGHKFVKTGINDSDQKPLFFSKEGSTLNLYSSKKNGEIYIAHLSKKENRYEDVLSTVCNVDANVNSATLNFGAFLDSNGNVIHDGDNLLVVGGSVVVTNGNATSTLHDDAKININLIGGKYHFVLRGSYSLITLKSPDAVINVDGIEMYGTYSSASLIHEYENFPTEGTVATVKNSKIYASHILYSFANGDYYFENNVLATAKTTFHNNFGGSITIGKGNVFAGTNNRSFYDAENIVIAEGVNFMKATATELGNTTASLILSPANLKWNTAFDLTFSSEFDGTLDAHSDVQYITAVRMKESALRTKVTSNLSYEIFAVSFTDDAVPDGISTIEWRALDGSLKAKTYEFPGTSATAPITTEEVGATPEIFTWYVKSYEWANTSGSEMNVAAGINVFKPAPVYTADIKNIRANVTLDEGMIFNLYLPAPDENISDITASGALVHGGGNVDSLGYVYIIKSTLPLDSFAPATVSFSFNVDGNAVACVLKADAIKYATAVAKTFECGTDEAALAYQLVAYKSAACDYLETAISDEEKAALSEFNKIYSNHSNCECTDEFDISDVPTRELNVNYAETLAGKVTGASFLLTPTYHGIKLEVAEGVSIDSVSYVDFYGERKSLDTEVQTDGSYIAKGLAAVYTSNVLTIEISYEGGKASGTYSLGKYIQNNPTVEISKNLYKYSVATRNYKLVTVEDTKVTVNFDSNGGTTVASIAVTYDRYAIEPNSPEKLGHAFKHWTLNGEAFDFASTKITEELTLVAEWEKLEDEEIFTGLQSVLLMGQSNMVGRGDPMTVDPIEDDRLLMLRGDKWMKMTEPLHTNTDISAIGLSASFGKAFVETFDCQLGLIPAAKGSTTIDMWAVGGNLYNEAVRLAKIAKESSNICAILWHQGESGGGTDPEYANKLEVILDSLIEEVGLDPEKIIIITGEIFEKREPAPAFTKHLENLASRFEHYGIARSNGLTVFDVTTHFDAHSLRLFGYRYFEQFYKIMTGKKYDYVDDPLYYLVPQPDVDENFYLPFDDVALGQFGTLYNTTISGNSRLGVLLAGGTFIVYEKEDDPNDRYMVASNSFNTNTENAYTANYVQSRPKMDANRVVVIEADYKLVSGVGAGEVTLLRSVRGADEENGITAANIGTVKVTNDGSIYVLAGNDKTLASDTAVGKLSDSEWVNVKVVLDYQKNQKDVYINGVLVAEDIVISSSIDLTDFQQTHVRLLNFATTSEGTLAVDNFKCYYLD